MWSVSPPLYEEGKTGYIRELEVVLIGVVSSNTPDGIKQLQQALIDSQYESSKDSLRVRGGMETKRQMGYRPGRAPTGYLNDPKGDKGSKKIFPDPERFELVKRILKTLLTGMHKPEEVRQMANNEWGLTTRKTKKQGGKPLSTSVYYAMLNNLFYTGWYLHNGKELKGEHKPMITREEYDQIQVILGKHAKPSPHSYEHAYTGEIFCGECGSQVTAEFKRQCVCANCRTKFSCRKQTACPECDTDISEMKNPKFRTYYHYHCTKNRGACNQPNVPTVELEKQIDAHLAKLQMNDKYLSWAIKHLKAAHKLESANQEAILRSKQRVYSEETRNLNRLLEMRMNNEIDAGEYQEAKSQGKVRQEAARTDVLKTEQRQHNWLELSERTFNFAAHARFWFADADKESNIKKKRQILTTLGSNLLLKDKILYIEAPEPFRIIEEALQEIPEARLAKNATFEPAKNAVSAGDKLKQSTSDSVVPEWSG